MIRSNTYGPISFSHGGLVSNLIKEPNYEEWCSSLNRNLLESEIKKYFKSVYLIMTISKKLIENKDREVKEESKKVSDDDICSVEVMDIMDFFDNIAGEDIIKDVNKHNGNEELGKVVLVSEETIIVSVKIPP